MQLMDDNTVWQIREAASRAGDCETSRLCSVALWSPSLSQRTRARNRLAKWVG